jgi:nitric oxide reductase activation protein
MHLHSFFSLDRPMLLLSQPTSRLFNTLPPPRAPAEDNAGETDADADAARALSHALVMSRVQSAADWAGAIQRLGVTADAADAREEARVQDDLDVLMDSVQRKRRKKITKHKCVDALSPAKRVLIP